MGRTDFALGHLGLAVGGQSGSLRAVEMAAGLWEQLIGAASDPRWALPWFLLAGAEALVVTGWAHSSSRRWICAGVALVAPLTAPSSGIGSTFLTAFAVVFAARLTDWDAFQRPRQRSAVETALWLLLPVVRGLPTAAEARSANRRAAPGFLLRAAAQKLTWEFLKWGLTAVPAAATSWWALKSAVLILFFVLHFTALAHLVTAIARACGCETEPVFDAPLVSKSPREFWSRRWNKFIARVLLKRVALALPRRIPRGLIVWAVFASSGVFHEYVVLGAEGFDANWGFMSGFFFLQALAVVLGEQTRWGLPRPVGTVLTFAWMVATAPLFFYPLRFCLLAFGYPQLLLPFSV